MMSIFTFCFILALTMPACGGSDDDQDEPENPENENSNTGSSAGEKISLAKLAGLWVDEYYGVYSAEFDTYQTMNLAKEDYLREKSFVCGFELKSDGTSTDYCWELRAFEQEPVLRVFRTSNGTIYWSRIDKSRGDYFYVKNGKLYSEDFGECRVVDNKFIVVGETVYEKIR